MDAVFDTIPSALGVVAGLVLTVVFFAAVQAYQKSNDQLHGLLAAGSFVLALLCFADSCSK